MSERGHPRSSRHERQRVVQVLLGLAWLADGALQLQPAMFGRGFVTGVLLPSANGNPALVAGAVRGMANFVEPHIAVWNAVFAATQLAIGAGLLLRRTVRPALLGSFAWSLLVWVFAEGLGGLLTGTASPLTGAPGAVLLYVLIGLWAWPERAPGASVGRADSASRGPVRETGTRIAWAVLWVGGALLFLQPANLVPGALRATVSQAGMGQPAWLAGALARVADLIGSHGTLLTLGLAAAMATVGIGVGLRWHDSALLGLAAFLALAIWVCGEGFGGILTGLGTDPNTGPLLALLAFALYQPRARDTRMSGPAPHFASQVT
ncbi:MAG: hypothetical protein ACYCYK_04535 [Candidatus Dormibacteria bacterium]